ncbi:serine/threonine-protein phosphatase 2A regulatory subunit B'' subunit alpha [Erpetoichthys calabaricus]|uniref:serine/threonine-protein phosphatase 2A regulatory subunit B'' subunit alpha n=1 Tax=Erpetoichthys calabaricus TaxID=27687 RepID=UPI00223478B2|nr:serine/threonine-protein phosphatase 2A regulatory subunit B'' subunit alpha [Erpetoichthys calabaricus]
MAATYRIVVSTINCYNSVVIDRRFQHTVHYCNGPCQVLKRGIECTIAHCSTCLELLDASAAPASNNRPCNPQDLSNKFAVLENESNAGTSVVEDFQQGMLGASRGKKGLSLQGSTSLKDITGEAINLASGKIKEFSFEKIKYTSSHVTLRKGRKVRPDSFSRRSTDLDIIYGHFGNDENCPPFGLVQKSVMEEHKLSRSTSLEQNINSVASLYLNSLTDENLISKILEKTKSDSSASGEDIKACLNILLKCSEDLKKCTDIIKQCIKRKSMGEGNTDSGTNPEVIYKNVMARLSSYLKKLPFELEHGQSDHLEHSDLAELVNSLHGLQQTPFSPIFGNEQPPRYEEVVSSPPFLNNLPPSSIEHQGPHHDSYNLVKSDSNFHTPSPNLILHSNEQQKRSTTGNSSSALPQSTAISKSDKYSSVNSLLSSSSDSICKDSMEALYIEEETDVGKVLSRELKGKNTFSVGLMEDLQLSKTSETTDTSVLRKGDYYKPNLESCCIRGAGVEHASKNVPFEQNFFQESGQGGAQDDIEKLLMDLECLSKKIEEEPLAKLKCQDIQNCIPQTDPLYPLTFESGSNNNPSVHADSSFTKKDPLKQISSANEEDRILLLRILESIENFAQELVETGSGKGNLAQEREVMRLLQETLGSTAKPERTMLKSYSSSVIRDTGPSLSIQQTPEVIKVQSRQEKKPGTPPPVPASSVLNPHPATPPPTVHKPVVTIPASINIPRFYFPKGLPNTNANLDETIAKIETTFAEFEEEKADIYEMGKIAKVCGCPLYWKAPMFNAAGGERTGFVSVHAFIAMWRKLLHSCYDDASKFVYLLAKPGCDYLEQEDFIPLLQDIVDTHPGLTFLKDAPEFHSRYITTVIQRIFYTVNRSWSGRISMTELRRSNFLQTLALLEEEDDINQITDYFSYEHFYVIYCKFWELDTDHDLFIDQKDLARYNDHALSNRIIERIFSGAVTRGNSAQKEGRMSYADFVWYLISEEDKKNATSAEYWFRCMDLDGDGVLSMYELEYFYEEQCERMEGMGIEPLQFHDLLCQMLDLVKPECKGKIFLRDLKRCRMAHIFYDTFFNLEKYLDHEQRDPFAVQKDIENDGPEPSDWDKYAAEEYEILVGEEAANEHLQEGSFEDDY